jgi:translation initiation factor 4G
VPSRGNKVTIKSSDGTEVDLGSYKTQQQQQPNSGGMAANVNRRSVSVRLESEEVRKKRLALEEREVEEKAKKEREEKARKEEEEQRKIRETEQERIRQTEAEQNQVPSVRGTRGGKRARKKERKRLEAEEAERTKKEGEVREHLKREEEKYTREENVSKGQAAACRHEAEAEFRKNPLTPTISYAAESMKPQRLDLDVTCTPNLAHILAGAHFITDLGRVPYPDGVSSPKVELNINAKGGKFM